MFNLIESYNTCSSVHLSFTLMPTSLKTWFLSVCLLLKHNLKLSKCVVGTWMKGLKEESLCKIILLSKNVRSKFYRFYKLILIEVFISIYLWHFQFILDWWFSTACYRHKRKYNTLIGLFPVFANDNKRAVLQRQTKSFRTYVYFLQMRKRK